MLPSTTISSNLKEKRDASHDFLKYCIAVKGCLVLNATDDLGPSEWAMSESS